nr:hypothetical protein [Klebsiella pneumoniae subsp. pneumoniae]
MVTRGCRGITTLCVAGQALAAEGKVTVFAAASLTNAMQDIARRTRKKTSRSCRRLPRLRRWRGR